MDKFYKLGNNENRQKANLALRTRLANHQQQGG